MVIDFTAYKERLLEEMFNVYSSRDKRKSISFVFHARVLGQYLLRNLLLNIFDTSTLTRRHYWLKLWLHVK